MPLLKNFWSLSISIGLKTKILKITYKALRELPSTLTPLVFLPSICALAHSIPATLASAVPGPWLGMLLIRDFTFAILSFLEDSSLLFHFFTSFQYFLKYHLIDANFPSHSINYCTFFRHNFYLHCLFNFPLDIYYHLIYYKFYFFLNSLYFPTKILAPQWHELLSILFAVLFPATRIVLGT